MIKVDGVVVLGRATVSPAAVGDRALTRRHPSGAGLHSGQAQELPQYPTSRATGNSQPGSTTSPDPVGACDCANQ